MYIVWFYVQTVAPLMSMHPLKAMVLNALCPSWRICCIHNTSNYRAMERKMRGNCVVTYNSDVKFKRDWKSLNPNLAASRFHKILR